MPETRDNIYLFPDGVCSACKSFELSQRIDFVEKERDLVEILVHARARGQHDCIIPVSGGKDSTYQVNKILDLGFRPLCIVILPGLRTTIGKENLRNLREMGVDLFEIEVEESVWRPIAKQAFLQTGSMLWFEIFCIFFRTIKEAEERGIPLIFWGENPGVEDGYPLKNACEPIDLGRWPLKVQGLDIFDVAKKSRVDMRAIETLIPKNFESVGRTVKGYFLGDFVKWDRVGNAIIAQKMGFRGHFGACDFSALPFENLDNPFFGIHNFVKFLQTGAGSICSSLSYLVRRNIVLRQDVFEWAATGDSRYPDQYLGYRLHELLNSVDLSEEEFENSCARFSGKLAKALPDSEIQKSCAL